MIEVKLTDVLISQEDGLRQVLQEMEALFEQNQTDVWGFNLVLEVILVSVVRDLVHFHSGPPYSWGIYLVSHLRNKCKNVWKQTWRELYFPFNQ